MKTFEFSKQTTKRIVEQYNKCLDCIGIIDDVMALTTIQRFYGNKCKIHVFKTYINKKIYAFYTEDNTILTFDNEKEAYNFILY